MVVLAVSSALVYPFVFPPRAEIVVRNLSGYPIRVSIETSDRSYRNARLETGARWTLPVSRLEAERWSLNADWINCEGRSEARGNVYGSADRVIELSDRGSLSSPASL
jgi:hypothetical protein